MGSFNMGDIVTRKSYGLDVFFRIDKINDTQRDAERYVLRGLILRLLANSSEDDLVKVPQDKADNLVRRYHKKVRTFAYSGRYAAWRSVYRNQRYRSGKVLHIDADRSFLHQCLEHYRKANIESIGEVYDESRQPDVVGALLSRYKPHILVLTGHDAMKKNSGDKYSIESYRNSKYFIKSVKEARKYERDYDKLCIFAGACQSYFEGIMDAGSNFASSPARILINSLDPAFVSEKVALTSTSRIVTPREIAQLTVSGRKGIGGINTRGQLAIG